MLLSFSYYKILAVFLMLYNTSVHLAACTSHSLTPVLPFSILPTGMWDNFFFVLFTSLLYFFRFQTLLFSPFCR